MGKSALNIRCNEYYYNKGVGCILKPFALCNTNDHSNEDTYCPVIDWQPAQGILCLSPLRQSQLGLAPVSCNPDR